MLWPWYERCAITIHSNITTNATNPNNDDGAADQASALDIVIVVLVFVATTGCFIYFLCKCSSAGISHEDTIPDLAGGSNDNNLSEPQQVVIELGEFDFIPQGLITSSVDLTLDQELSEDEGSIHHISQNR